MKKLTFGVNVSTSARDGDNPVAEAMRAEALGYDFVSANDHPCGIQASYETWTMLTWIAAKTTRIKVASRVLGVPYRAPAMVAKMAESLDRFSDGRLILGMGAGYSDDEFKAFGLPVPSPKEKIEGLEEAVRIVRGLWTSPGFTFEGRHHRTDAADIEPKPAHHTPIWLGDLRATGAGGHRPRRRRLDPHARDGPSDQHPRDERPDLRRCSCRRTGPSRDHTRLQHGVPTG